MNPSAGTDSRQAGGAMPSELPVHDLVAGARSVARPVVHPDDAPGGAAPAANEQCRRARIFRMASSLLGTGKLEDALTVFDYLTLLDPFNPAYWIAGGIARMKLGMLEEAAGSFQVAEAASDADPIPVLMRALCRLRQGRESEATAALVRAHSLVLACGDCSWVKETIERHMAVLEGRAASTAAA